jgi:hypothetical protein
MVFPLAQQGFQKLQRFDFDRSSGIKGKILWFAWGVNEEGPWCAVISAVCYALLSVSYGEIRRSQMIFQRPKSAHNRLSTIALYNVSHTFMPTSLYDPAKFWHLGDRYLEIWFLCPPVFILLRIIKQED